MKAERGREEKKAEGRKKRGERRFGSSDQVTCRTQFFSAAGTRSSGDAKDACRRFRKEQKLSRFREYEIIDRSRQIDDEISTISTISTGNINDSARRACGLLTSAEEKEKEQQV